MFTCKVERVSDEEEIEGDIQTINHILPLPLKESDNTLVNLEFRKGICVLDFSIKADMQWPKHDKLPLMEVNSLIRKSFSSFVKS